MRFALERLTEPSIEPVTLTEAKLHLRESTTDRDTEITNLIIGAREWVEEFTGRAMVDQMWRLSLGDNLSPVGYLNYPSYYGYWNWSTEIVLRRSPILSIVSFAAAGTDGIETDFSAATYQVRGANSRFPRLAALTGATWTTLIPGQELRVVFRAGYADTTGSPTGSAADVPERYKQAIKLWIEANYDRNEKMMGILLDTAERLVQNERVELSLA